MAGSEGSGLRPGRRLLGSFGMRIGPKRGVSSARASWTPGNRIAAIPLSRCKDFANQLPGPGALLVVGLQAPLSTSLSESVAAKDFVG